MENHHGASPTLPKKALRESISFLCKHNFNIMEHNSQTILASTISIIVKKCENNVQNRPKV